MANLIPTHLAHRPIIKVENYSQIDGRFANNTDAVGLSIGLAQWGSHDTANPDISVKVWRHSGERWSRQSEELPLHRAVDLVSLLCSALSYSRKELLLSKTDFNVTSINNEYLLEKLKLGFEKEQPYLDNSLKRLAKMLKELGYCD